MLSLLPRLRFSKRFSFFTDDEYQDTKPSPALLAKSLEDYVQDDDGKFSIIIFSSDQQLNVHVFQLITMMKIRVAINSIGQQMLQKR